MKDNGKLQPTQLARRHGNKQYEQYKVLVRLNILVHMAKTTN